MLFKTPGSHLLSFAENLNPNANIVNVRCITQCTFQ